MRFGEYLHLVSGEIGKHFAIFENLLDHHLDYFVNMAIGFLFSMSPGCRSVFLQCRAVGMPAVTIGFDYDLEIVGFHFADFPDEEKR